MKKGYKKFKRVLGILLMVAVLNGSLGLDSLAVRAAEGTSDAAQVEKGGDSVASQKQAEDMTVSSQYVLEKDMIVQNLTVKNNLDLNGYRLTVQGDLKHENGRVLFNKGELLCEGDYTVTGNGYLQMSNDNDYMLVEGNFVCEALYGNNSFKAGITEIKGNFSQKNIKNYLSSEENFVCSGTHKTIFSGEKRQEIHFDSPASYFNKVIFRNGSEEGIYSNGLFHSLSMERNSTRLHAGCSGTYGWKLAEDEEIEGDLVLLGDTLDLAGHTLTVRGNLIQQNGTISINGGKLDIKGDYRIQQEEDKEPKVGAASAQLIMKKSEDRICVGGNFITWSAISHKDLLQEGVIEVKGNIEQIKYRKEDNLVMTSESMLRLSGEQKQTVTMNSAGKQRSRLSGIDIQNSQGVELKTDIYVSGNVSDHGNPVSGKNLVVQKETTFTGKSFSGNIKTEDGFTLNELEEIKGNYLNTGNMRMGTDLTVHGDFESRYECSLGGHRLNTEGNVKIVRNLSVDKGKLICRGNFELAEDSGYGSNLIMRNQEDYVQIQGDFYAHSRYPSSSMSGGTLEIQGDFEHTSPGNKGNFCASETHITKFSGEKKQTVRFADDSSYFNHVEIENTNVEGVYAPNGINCVTMNRNGHKVTTDQKGEFGWKLTKDEVYEGDLYLISDELNLNGYTLHVKGNLIQSAGTVNVNNGELLVDGDYRIQSEVKKDGGTDYDKSLGTLLMNHEDDRVVVNGSFAMGSIYSHNGKLTAGVLSVKGDFGAVKYKAADNLVTTGTHLLVLDGSEEQRVNLSDPSFYNMRIANVRMENKRNEGIVFEKNVPVTGNVDQQGGRAKGYLLINPTTTFAEGEYRGDILANNGGKINGLSSITGDIRIRSNVSLSRKLQVNGKLYIESGSLSLGKMELSVTEDIVILNGSLQAAKGSCICDGNLTLEKTDSGTSHLVMVNPEDYILVKGNVYVRSRYCPRQINAGVLEIKGDFIQEKTYNDDGFVATGGHRVVFSGEQRQTVNFATDKSCFSYVEIQNPSEEGVYSEKGIHCLYLNTNQNIYLTGMEGETGWTLQKDEVRQGDLVLVSGTLDLQGKELIINGDFIQKGGRVKINNGRLVVKGDYLIGDGSTDDNSMKGSWGTLSMQEPGDKIVVEGDFTMASFLDHDTLLTDGELTVCGNLSQKAVGTKLNLATSGGFTLVMAGNDMQQVKMETADSRNSRIANLILRNTGEKGVFLNGMPVTGKVVVEKGAPRGELCAFTTTEFQDNIYEGDVLFKEYTVYGKPLHVKGFLTCTAGFVMNRDMVVEGDLRITSNMDLKGNTLQVNGSVYISGAVMDISRGKFICGHNLKLEYCSWRSSGLRMFYDEDRAVVQGNLYVNTAGSCPMQKGVLELKGDFIQNQYSNSNSFVPSDSFVVILNGDEMQRVYFSAKDSHFGTLRIENESEEGICFENETVRATKLERNGCRVSCRGSGTYGWRLEEDMVIQDDLYIVMDDLDLNGHKLEVNGNLYIGAGNVKVNGGTLNVSGDLKIQEWDGKETFSSGNGMLVMTDPEDHVLVGRDFVIQTKRDPEGQFTSGKLELKGDFYQKNASGRNENFRASRDHQMIFSGEREQKVYFETFSNCGFMNVDLIKSQKGVHFVSSARAYGDIEDREQRAVFDKDKYMHIGTCSQLKEGKFGGNIKCDRQDVLTQDVDIAGDFVSGQNIDLNGHTLSAASFRKDGGKFSVNRGKLVTEHNFETGVNGYLCMEHDDDRIRVKGDFSMASNNTNNKLCAGQLEISGDVTVTGSHFLPCGSHQTILSGKVGRLGREYVQTVNINHAASKFNELVLTKKRDKFYSFSKDVEQLCDKLTLLEQDSEAPLKVQGIHLKEKGAVSISLEWEASEDNESTVSYQIFRGSRQVGETKDTYFTDTGLKPAQGYDYVIYAVDESGNISESSDVFVAETEVDIEPPTKPEGINLFTRTGSSLTIGWRKSKDNVGITGYRIYRNGEFVVQVDAAAREYKDINRSTDAVNRYQVSAVDGAGNESELSEAVSGSAQMPEILKMSPGDGSELGGKSEVLQVYYKNVGNSMGNRVRFEYSTDKGETWRDINAVLLGQNTSSYSTLTSQYTWDFSRIKSKQCLVRATVFDADDNMAQKIVSYKLDTDPPLAPECLNAESNNGLVELSWNASDTANCVKYEIYRAREGEEFKRIQTLAGRENTYYIDRDVTHQTTYSYFVKAVDAYKLVSEESQKFTIMVDADLEKPRVLEFTANKKRLCKNTVLTVKAVDNIGVTSAVVQYFHDGKWVDAGDCEVSEGIGSCVFNTEVLEDGEYTFRVLAEDRNGNISEGFTQNFEVDNHGIEKVEWDKVSAYSDKVRLTWKAVSDKDIDCYVVEQLIDGKYKEVARERNTLGVFIRELEAETTYTFRVAGYDDIGNRGEFSEKVEITTKKDTILPYVTKFDPVPSYFSERIPIEITARDNNELGRIEFHYSRDKITWNKAGSVEAPSGMRQYTYFYEMDIKGLQDGEFYVQAVVYDSEGNKNTKGQAIRSFYKLTKAPEPMKDISVSAKDGYVVVNWRRPQEESFASFDLYRKVGKDGTYQCVDGKSTALNYIDTDVEDNQQVFYKLRVNDLAGNQSEFSREVSTRVLPDREKPKVYGVEPVNKKKVGRNPKIRTLVADNRRLKSVVMEFRKLGAEDFWTQIYNEEIQDDSKEITVTWENEELANGDYEFRIIAEDWKGSVSSEYRFSYSYDRDFVENKKDDTVPVPEKPGEQEKEEEEDLPQIYNLRAILPASYSLREGKEEIFDGTESRGDVPVVEWNWEFGNGDTAEGERVTYAYPEAGNYTLKLTVKDADGNVNSVTSSVDVCPKSSGGVSLCVQDDNGQILENAQIHIQKAGEKKGKVYSCNAGGELELALNPGRYEISAYQSGHLPENREIKINPGAVKKVNFVLESQELITGVLSHRKLDVREMLELGIDLEDPDNWYTYRYCVITYLRGEPKPKTYEFNVSEKEWTYVDLSGNSGKRSIGYTVLNIGSGYGDQILVSYEVGEYLKQMFEVELRIQNQAKENFVITDGKATLNLPTGLSLAGMKNGDQSEAVRMEDIPGQSEQSVKWYIRGDQPGQYHIDAKYLGRLQPFDAPVSIAVRDSEPVVVTDENTNTNTDDGFLDPDKETKNYQILVTNTSGERLKGAYVEMQYGDLSTRGITDGDGLVWLEVNEDEERRFRLTAKCSGHLDYVKEEYKVKCGDYMDSIRMVKESDTSYMSDENEDYEGDFELKSVILNGIELSKPMAYDERVKINSYDNDRNTVNLAFNENVTSASIVIKGDNDNIYSEVAVKNGLSSNHVTLDFKSNRLVEGYRMYVRAVDEKTGCWHLYPLYFVEIVYKKPARFNKKIAEQCALYSALAYKAVIKENGKFSDGFSYDTNTDFLSDKLDEEIEPKNKGFVSLEKKLEMDNFVIDNKYMYVNYGEDLDTDGAKDNCSFSIVRRDTVKGGVIYVIIRGTDRVEWYGNMEITGEFYDKDIMNHASFKSAEKQVYKRLSEYIRENNLFKPEIVVTGHSRGAAIANLLAADIISKDDSKHSWKDEESDDIEEKEVIRAGKVSAYTFATPNVTLYDGTQKEDYNTIFNFCFTDDFVPQVPMEKWEYGKYGNTIPLDSERYSISSRGTKYNEYRKKVRSVNKKITYASENTKMLISHISRKWRNVEQYYTVKKPKMTLYEFMHDKVAAAIVEESIFANALPKLSVAVNALYNKESDLYVVARYFLAGSELFHNYIFDTHNADNYYAAILSDGFDTSSVEDIKLNNNEDLPKYLSPAQVYSDTVNLDNSDDIRQFQRFLRSERNVASGEESVKMPVYELLKWDVENTDTWEGVTIQDGRITAIELPLAVLGGTLDLSGLDKLESLKCLYNGFEDISLERCSSLKTLLLGGQKIEELDLSGCHGLESVNVSDNHLKKILWGSYSSLKWLNCSANYLDIDTDESLIEVIRTLKVKGIDPAYKYQRYDEKAEYNQQDLGFVRGLLAQGENEVLLGWDKEDLSTWTGIQWKTVAGKNYINRIDIARKELTGSLIATDLKYVREIVCGENRFKKLDITGCKSLEFVNCSAGELEELLLGDNDSLLYLDCLNNQLVVDDIEKECQKIASRTGSEVYYERQYINADRIAFCGSECRILEQFADLDSNKEILNWNLDKPGMIPNIQWKVQDGVYRVKELKIYGDKVGGKLDLSGFEALSRVCLVGTEINQVILPSHMKEIEEGSFVNCRKLESVILPEKIISIGKQAFASCEKLHQIDFPSGLQKIGEEAFLNCYSLKEITLGKEISEIGKYAFAGCSNLKKAVFSGDAPQNPGDDIFYGTADDFCIYYEKDSKGWQEPYWLKYRTALLGESTSPTTPESQKPASSSEPLPTQPPVKTNLPVNTSKPAETEEPESTAKPEHTWKPEETTAPSGVQEPKSTKDPGGDSPFQDTDQPPAASIPGEQKQQPQLNLETADQSSDWAEGTVSGKKTGYKNMSYKVKKAKVLKYKLKKRKLKVVIRRDKNVTGYEVYYRKGKKGKYKVVRRKGWKNNVILLRNLKKGTFYVKVRVYKKVNGKKYYSKFTKSKKVTVR